MMKSRVDVLNKNLESSRLSKPVPTEDFGNLMLVLSIHHLIQTAQEYLLATHPRAIIEDNFLQEIE